MKYDHNIQFILFKYKSYFLSMNYTFKSINYT